MVAAYLSAGTGATGAFEPDAAEDGELETDRATGGGAAEPPPPPELEPELTGALVGAMGTVSVGVTVTVRVVVTVGVTVTVRVVVTVGVRVLVAVSDGMRVGVGENRAGVGVQAHALWAKLSARGMSSRPAP